MTLREMIDRLLGRQQASATTARSALSTDGWALPLARQCQKRLP